jgi:hypothetical protein
MQTYSNILIYKYYLAEPCLLAVKPGKHDSLSGVKPCFSLKKQIMQQLDNHQAGNRPGACACDGCPGLPGRHAEHDALGLPQFKPQRGDISVVVNWQ